ncbi:sulfonate transport system substrate-binding protein [Actinoplanes octamycinicus]|uniref:Sulfonate transport system substrate-binding protein n=1 Tax=Actinoplanes octamycinicus TaxID=135948 RepID=A0A7W7H6P8_9ACTN|nr:ABC transporter substrate-binding protein [Actinoplanes octamycinicus]MBB4744854.1 sulfonate transport system substrate-binding protein [Actinoplanes octamycinicus]GIE55440.1 ABC transporter substrate-binding protein [Actinoplanes octamycinicus]
MTSPILNRRTLLGGLLGVTALGLTGCAGDDAASASLSAADPLPTTVDPATQLIISIHTSQVGLTASGEIAKLPFKVKDWPNISAGPDVIQGFRAKAIDLANNAGIPPIQAAAINVDAKIVAVQTVHKPQYTFVTSPGNPVKGITDLRGKKIAFSQGQAQGLVVLRTLKEQGLSPKDVQLIALPSTKFLVALQSKQVDIAPLYEPAITKYLAEYGKDGATQFPMTAVDYLSVLWAPSEVLADSAKVAAIRSFIPFWAKDQIWRWENPDKWLDAYYVKDQQVSAADAKRIGTTLQQPYFPKSWDKALAWEKESADLLVEGGFIKKIDPEKLFDRRFEGIASAAVPAKYQE